MESCKFVKISKSPKLTIINFFFMIFWQQKWILIMFVTCLLLDIPFLQSVSFSSWEFSFFTWVLLLWQKKLIFWRFATASFFLNKTKKTYSLLLCVSPSSLHDSSFCVGTSSHWFFFLFCMHSPSLLSSSSHFAFIFFLESLLISFLFLFDIFHVSYCSLGIHIGKDWDLIIKSENYANNSIPQKRRQTSFCAYVCCCKRFTLLHKMVECQYLGVCLREPKGKKVNSQMAVRSLGLWKGVDNTMMIHFLQFASYFISAFFFWGGGVFF